MTEYKIPTEPISKSDFDKQHCQEILEKAACNDYVSMYQAFSTASKQAMDNGDAKQGKIYWLLSDACSLILSPESRNKPFKVSWTFQGRRSAILEDFTDEYIDFFIEIVNDITDARLKARLTDIIWLLRKDVQYALLAIDSYKEIPIDNNEWAIGTDECWRRAISLAIMLGQETTGEQIKDMEKIIFKTFNSVTELNNFSALWIANLMSDFNLGKDNSEAISQRLEFFAKKIENNGGLLNAKDYFEFAAKWYKIAANEIKQFEMIFFQGECFAKEARNRLTGEQPSNIDAAAIYGQAIETLRSIPKSHRPNFKIDERIKELHNLMNQAAAYSFSELRTVSSGEVDISDCVRYARKSVAGKNMIDAMFCFSNITEIQKIAKLRDEAIEIVKNNFFPILSGTHISRDGRVIARTTGVEYDESLTEENPDVHAIIMRNYNSTCVPLSVQAKIIQALRVIHLEHRVRMVDFLEIARLSSIVPRDRIHLFAKGLFAGYDGDFSTALHILAPQLENMVRYHLKKIDIKTTNLDSQGIENENGLSSLVKLQEMKKIFGDDVTFEIEALFCDSMGANLRNEIAHGLINDAEINSIHEIYAWWFILRLVFNNYWNINHKKRETAGESEKTDV